MKLARNWVEELTNEYEIGNSSQFCDDAPDWDLASDQDLQIFIEKVQLDALK